MVAANLLLKMPRRHFGRKRHLLPTVTLTTASQKEGTAYTLTVANVKAKTVAPAVAKDLAGTQVFTGFSTTPGNSSRRRVDSIFPR